MKGSIRYMTAVFLLFSLLAKAQQQPVIPSMKVEELVAHYK